jgi:hypothetical protein
MIVAPGTRQPLVIFALISGYLCLALAVWYLLEPRPRFMIEGPCRPADFTRDGRYVATYLEWTEKLGAGGQKFGMAGHRRFETGPVQLWDMHSGRATISVMPQPREFLGLQISPDDRWLAIPDGADLGRTKKLHVFSAQRDLPSNPRVEIWDMPQKSHSADRAAGLGALTLVLLAAFVLLWRRRRVAS